MTQGPWEIKREAMNEEACKVVADLQDSIARIRAMSAENNIEAPSRLIELLEGMIQDIAGECSKLEALRAMGTERLTLPWLKGKR